MQAADSTNTATGTRSIRGDLDRFFASLGQGFNAYLETLSRARELAQLNSLSDRQLAAIGLRREEIVRHVFRDKFYF